MLQRAVLSFPYEGGLYYLLNEHLGWIHSVDARSHGYYGVLLGADAHLVKSKATALGALFEEIILVGADASLPDRDSSIKDGNYWHPDFRIRVPNAEYAEWGDDNRKLAEQLLDSIAVRNAFQSSYATLDHQARLQVLCRLLLQMRAAQTYDATIVGDSKLCSLHDVVLKVLGTTGSGSDKQFVSESLAMESTTLRIVGLEFDCSDVSAFAAVRQSKEIRAYAGKFREAISTANEAPDVTRRLLTLMKEARDTSAIAGKIAGGFETSSTIVGVAGVIPFVGSATGLIGMGTDAAARVARKTQRKREWYAIGAHMQRVALDDLLTRS